MVLTGAAMAATNVVMDELAPLRAIARGGVLWGADAGTSLEDTINRAEFLLRRERCREALPLLLHLHDTVGTAEWDRVYIDGCTLRFWLYAGLSRVCEALYYEGERDIAELGRTYAARARALPVMNAWRLGLLLAYLSFMAPKWEAEFDQTRMTALELYPAAVWQMDHVARRLAWRLDYCGRTRAALAEYEKLFRRNPRAGSWVYVHAGVLAAWLGEYQKAFDYWYEGLRSAPLTPCHNYGNYQIVMYLRQHLPYADARTLAHWPRVMRGVAARYPAEVKEAASIAHWLALANDEQVAFETRVREMEERNDPAVSNVWEQGLARYDHPEYARKLGLRDREAALLCQQLAGQKRLVRALILARRIEGLAGHMSSATSNQFARALVHRWKRIGRYRREARTNADIGGMVAELEGMKKRWEPIYKLQITNYNLQRVETL